MSYIVQLPKSRSAIYIKFNEEGKLADCRAPPRRYNGYIPKGYTKVAAFLFTDFVFVENDGGWAAFYIGGEDGPCVGVTPSQIGHIFEACQDGRLLPSSRGLYGTWKVQKNGSDLFITAATHKEVEWKKKNSTS